MVRWLRLLSEHFVEETRHESLSDEPLEQADDRRQRLSSSCTPASPSSLARCVANCSNAFAARPATSEDETTSPGSPATRLLAASSNPEFTAFGPG